MVIRMMGGLGNQMFQYAFYRSLKKKSNRIKVDLSFYKTNKEDYKLSLFPQIRVERTNAYIEVLLSFKVVRKILKLCGVYYVEKNSHCKKYISNKIIFEGYFQNEKYFRNIKKEIINDFKFPKGEKKLCEVAKQISTLDNSVSIHVRRGDYLELNKIYGGICTTKYYKTAVSIFDKDTTFIVFSNDIEWVKINLCIPNAMYISDKIFDAYEDWYDMYLMSICKNNIIANSTFSWWGAYLNSNINKKVICPVKWNNCSDEKMKIDNWLEINSEGEVI